MNNVMLDVKNFCEPRGLFQANNLNMTKQNLIVITLN